MKKQKFIIYVTITLIALQSNLLNIASSSAAKDGISVTINNKAVAFDVPPQIINERTMVPVRAIFETLGATVEWNQINQTITSTKEDTTIVLKINDYTMYVNGTPISLDTPACIINERTLVPVRAVSEALNTIVNWDADTQTVIIKEKEEKIESNVQFEDPPISTPEPEIVNDEDIETDSFKEYKYYFNSSLITYNSFCDVKMVKVQYAYHYFPYDKEEFNAYIELLKSEGWTITSKNKKKKNDVYAQNENGERARILYNSSQVVIVTNEKYIDFPSGTLLNEAGEQIKAVLNEKNEEKEENKVTNKKDNTEEKNIEYIRRQAEDAFRRILNKNNVSINGATGAVLADAIDARNAVLSNVEESIRKEINEDWLKDITKQNIDFQALFQIRSGLK